MKKMQFVFLFTSLLFLSQEDINREYWVKYTTCELGRLQSPINLTVKDSKYSEDFSFIYQEYRNESLTLDLNDSNSYTAKTNEVSGGYVTFEKGGIMKQYEFIRAELYKGLHIIDGAKPDYELHLIHKKNLKFATNKNQYKSIQDANNYLTVALRYTTVRDTRNATTSDNGLLKALLNGDSGVNLADYPIFQDKRAFLYEGSIMHIPCDEDVNYYVVKDLFYIDSSSINATKGYLGNVTAKDGFDRPVYRNFMNYTEYSFSQIYTVKILMIFSLLYILL